MLYNCITMYEINSCYDSKTILQYSINYVRNYLQLQQAITVTAFNYFSKTNRCHKSGFWNGFVDNAINVSTNISETHSFHTNSSRRTCWCACQLLVVCWWSHKSWNLWIRKSRSSIYACYYSINQTISKSQICHKNQQWHRNMICLDMVFSTCMIQAFSSFLGSSQALQSFRQRWLVQSINQKNHLSAYVRWHPRKNL